MNSHNISLFELAADLRASGEYDQVERLAARHLVADPACVEALRLLGAMHLQKDEPQRAEDLLRRAQKVAADPVDVLCELSQTLHVMGRDEEAEKLAKQAAILAPDLAGAHHQVGASMLGRSPSAAVYPHFERAVRCDPNHGRALYGCASMLHRMGRATEALDAIHRAIAVLPPFADVLALGAHIFLDHGRIPEALAYYNQAIQTDPTAVAVHSNFLMTMIYASSWSAKQKAAAHRLWAAMHADPLLPAEASFEMTRDPDRRLRIGFVSGDFTRHAVSYFLFPLFRAINRDSVEVCCYSNTAHPGAATVEFKGLADLWRDILNMGDQEAADLIMADRVDILIDLSGHTAGNRLLVFARRPAPIQISWLGYPATTGMRAIDYRLTDEIADPVGMTEDFHSETLLRLPPPFLCYEPVENLPVPKERRPGAPLTFGSFNNISKVTREVVVVWAQILARVPNSQILIKSRYFAELSTRERYAEWMETEGVARNRIRFVGHVDGFAQHLAFYDEIDIALDPFPYNGTTTTCEALWMGVPVVTSLGDAHSERVGATLLDSLGLRDLVAQDQAAYVSIAAALANDSERLANLRRTMRQTMAASKLRDAGTFASNFETVLRTVWKSWCRPAPAG